MKITKLRIRNLFGLKAFDSDGSDKELVGKNGVGKSAVIDAIRYALTNKTDREYLISNGETEGEVFIETTTGLSINRKPRTNKADYKSIKQNGKDENESFLREIFTELQLNPVEFASMSVNEQNRIILDMIDFKWDLTWIKEEFGEIVPDVNYDQNILCVLHDIQADEGYYFTTRQDINREIRNKMAFIAEIGTALPPGYDAAKWDSVNLGDVYKKIETIRNKNEQIEKAKNIVKNRDNKVRSFEAEYEIEKATIDRLTVAVRTGLEKLIADLKSKIKTCEVELSNLEEKKIGKLEVAKKTYEAKVAEFDGEVKQFADLAGQSAVDFSALQEEAETVERMKSFVNEYARMLNLQDDVERLKVQTEELTWKIEHARALPGQILETSKVPIDGLTIKDGLPLINGLPISNLSEGEKFQLCIDVATQNPNSLELLLLDGIEKLATAKREQVYAKLKDKGVQFLASRTSDDEKLTVIEL